MPDHIHDAVLTVLRSADRPLTVREIYAQSDEFEGHASVASAVNALVRQGEAEYEMDVDGHRYYGIPGKSYPAAAPAPAPKPKAKAKAKAKTKPTPETPPKAAPSPAPSTAISYDRVREDIRSHPSSTSHDIAARLGVEVRRVQKALTYLGHQGEVVRVGTQGQRTVWSAADAAPSDNTAATDKPSLADTCTASLREPVRVNADALPESAGRQTAASFRTLERAASQARQAVESYIRTLRDPSLEHLLRAWEHANAALRAHRGRDAA